MLEMTIGARKHSQIFSENDKVLVFDGENGELDNSEERLLLKMNNEHQKLQKTSCNATVHQNHFIKRVKNEKDNVQGEQSRTNVCGDKSQKDKRQVDSKLTTNVDCDHLLILAQSAEMMQEAEIDPSQRGNESDLLELDNAGDSAIAGQSSAVEQINEMYAVNHRREEIQSNVRRTPRLTQIRHLARSRSKFPMQPMIGKHTGWNLHGRRVRLTDIRRLARNKFQMHSTGEEEKQLCGNSGEKTLRLSQLKQMARFKSDSLMLKAVNESIPAHLHCRTNEGPVIQKAKIIEQIFGAEDSLRFAADGEAPVEIISAKGRAKASRLQT